MPIILPPIFLDQPAIIRTASHGATMPGIPLTARPSLPGARAGERGDGIGPHAMRPGIQPQTSGTSGRRIDDGTGTGPHSVHGPGPTPSPANVTGGDFIR